MTEIHGHICSTPVYQYEHDGRTWLIEVPPIGGPCPLKADGSPYLRIPRGFGEALDALRAEPDMERYRIGGGCIRF